MTFRLKRFLATHPLHDLNVKDLEKLGLLIYKQMNTAYAKYPQPPLPSFPPLPNSSWNPYLNLVFICGFFGFWRTQVTDSGTPKDMLKLDRICSPKFADSLKTSILQRDPGEKYEWKWIKQVKKPKMISFVALPVIKGHPESEIVQAVIRIQGKEVGALACVSCLCIPRRCVPCRCAPGCVLLWVCVRGLRGFL